jgi:hypothetical protein
VEVKVMGPGFGGHASTDTCEADVRTMLRSILEPATNEPVKG